MPQNCYCNKPGGYPQSAFQAAFDKFYKSVETYPLKTWINNAGFLMKLYDSNKTAGIVDRKDFSFHLSDPEFPYAKNPLYNQNIMQSACKQI